MKMLGEIEANFGIFTVTAKPKSRWRRILRDFLPYIQGQKVDFEIFVRVLDDLTTDAYLDYSVENTGGFLSWKGTIKQAPMRKGEKAKYNSIKIPLYRSGDSLFTIWQREHIQDRQAAFIFHTTSRNTIFLTVVGIAVTVLVATITIIWSAQC